jgi:hypothetical protein
MVRRDSFMADQDERIHFPATMRNRDAILDVLRRVMPPAGLVLEVASGTGEHAAHFAPRLHPRRWQPSEPDPRLRRSVTAWAAALPAENLLAPLALDLAAPDWWRAVPERPSAIVAINLLHIAAWTVGQNLLHGAGVLLDRGGIVYLYGAYMRHGAHTHPRNAAFDASLRAENPDWGLRDIEAVAAEAAAHGLVLAEEIAMPANNLSLVLHKE